MAEEWVEECVDHDRCKAMDSSTNQSCHAAEMTGVATQEQEVAGNDYWEILQEESWLCHWEDVETDV